MNTVVLVAALLMLAAGANAASFNWTNDRYDATAVNCSGACDEEGKTVCYNGECVQCNPFPTGGVAGGAANGNCMCPNNQYCTTGDGVANGDLGSCVDYPREDFIGKNCDPSVTAFNAVKDATDKLFCGEIVWEDSPIATLPPIARVEWQGACVRGQCQICAHSDQRRFSGAGGGFCGSKFCYNGEWATGTEGVLSWPGFAVMPMSISLFFIMVFCYCCFPCIFFFAFKTWREGSGSGGGAAEPHGSVAASAHATGKPE